MDDFIFNNFDYKQLQKEYNKQLKVDNFCINYLNCIIKTLENNNFQMPLNLQNSVLNTLSNAQQILNLLYKKNSCSTLNLQNNPFELIKHLNKISLALNSHTLKSAYQILYLKSNNLILDATNQICNYFSNKKIRIFHFI